MSQHPFREAPAGRALQRAQIIVYFPLGVAAAIMVLAGYRMGLSIITNDNFGPVSSDFSFAATLSGIAIGIGIIITIAVHPHKPVVARWLVGCGLSMILGLTLGSWP